MYGVEMLHIVTRGGVDAVVPDVGVAYRDAVLRGVGVIDGQVEDDGAVAAV